MFEWKMPTDENYLNSLHPSIWNRLEKVSRHESKSRINKFHDNLYTYWKKRLKTNKENGNFEGIKVCKRVLLDIYGEVYE